MLFLYICTQNFIPKDYNQGINESKIIVIFSMPRSRILAAQVFFESFYPEVLIGLT